MTYAQKEFSPDRMIDLATLTGAMVISLGHEHAGIFSNDDDLAEDLIEWQKIEQNHGEELILPFTFDFVAWPSILKAAGHGEQPSRFESDYDTLFSSMRFEGMLTNRRYNIRHLVVDIEGLEEKSRAIVERLKNQ